MDKVLVEMFCAATIKKYDFWIPKTMKIKDVIRKVIEEIETYESNGDLFEKNGDEMLVHYERRVILNLEYTVEESGIVNGQRLMIV